MPNLAKNFKKSIKKNRPTGFSSQDRETLLSGGTTADFLPAISDLIAGKISGRVFGGGNKDVVIPLPDDNQRRAKAQRRRAKQSKTGYQSTVLTQGLGG